MINQRQLKGMTTLDGPSFAHTHLTDAIVDNTATDQGATTAFAKSEDAVLRRSPGQAVNVIASTGSPSISVTDSPHTDFGSGDFTLVWKGSLPDWTPSGDQRLLAKYLTVGWVFDIVSSTGKLDLYMETASGSPANLSTVAPTLVDGTVHELAVVVTRGTSLVFYVDGVQLGDAVTNTLAGTVDNAANLYVLGNATTLHSGTCSFAATYNRALTAAEVLDLYRNGIPFADKWGSQTAEKITAQNDRDFSSETIGNWGKVGDGNGTVVYDAGPAAEKTGLITYGATAGTYLFARLDFIRTTCLPLMKYRVKCDVYIPSANNHFTSAILALATANGATFTITKAINLVTVDAWQTTIAEMTLGSSVPSYLLLYTESTTVSDKIYFDNVSILPIGATLALQPEGIQADKWYDGSTNALDASYPTSGSSLTLDYQLGTESLLSITNVSLASNADTTIYTVPTGRRLILTKALLVAGADAGATSAISIGADGTETDFIPAAVLSNLDAANDVVLLQPVPVAALPVKNKSYAAGTVIQAQVGTQSGGATNALYLFGVLY